MVYIALRASCKARFCPCSHWNHRRATDMTMQRKDCLLSGALASIVLATGLLFLPAWAQPSIYGPAHQTEIEQLLRRGWQLEMEGRWGEAVGHYEEAVRQFPGDRGLEERFQHARLHYELGRRYRDKSFCNLVSQLSFSQALDVLGDVLRKIQVHYVESPHWKALVEDGTHALNVALSEPAFLQRHCPGADPRRVAEFRGRLRRTLGPMLIQSPADVRSAVELASRLAQTEMGVRPAAVVMEFVCGMIGALDIYSAYLTPDQLAEVYSQIEGSFVGLGVELKADQGSLLIVRVIPGSPAEAAGIRAGDRITAVDGIATSELTTDQAADLLQGRIGTVAELEVVTPPGTPRAVRVRRRHIDVPSVEGSRIIDPDAGVAYFKITCFQKTTTRDVDAALWSLYRHGMRSLVIDLRGNPGGLLNAAVEVADRFVSRGLIVSTRGRAVQEDVSYVAHASGTWRVPLVVMIDQDSASAAEIFAGAIRDHRRGTIVGTRSYGKGSVQGIFPLETTGAGVRLTTARFYSPRGRTYCRVGVQPDLVVHQVARPTEDGAFRTVSAPEYDPALTAAVQAARRLASHN